MWYLHINSSWIFCSLLLLLIHMDYPWAHVEDFLFHNCFWQFKRLTRRLLKENQLLVIRKLQYNDMLHFEVCMYDIFRNNITHNPIKSMIRYAHFFFIYVVWIWLNEDPQKITYQIQCVIVSKNDMIVILAHKLFW